MSEDSRFHVIEWDMMDRNKFLSLSVVSSLIQRSILYPLVLVKTRLQVQKQNTVYTGSLDAFKKIIKTEGFCGLYKGFWVNSVNVVYGITYITTYEKTRDIVANYTNISDSKAKAFLSGGISSAVSQTLIIPFDIISQHIMVALNTRRQDHYNNNNNINNVKNGKRAPVAEFKSTYFRPLNFAQDDLRRYGIAVAIVRQLYRDGGIRSFYKGYFATLICFVPSSACWWMLYQHFNEFLFSSTLTKDMPYMFLNGMSGILSGASASIMTNPLDLLRTNIQVHRPSSYRSAVKYLWKEDKWRIFSKGLSARLTHSCISSGLIVIGYETMKRFSLDEKYRDQIGW